MAVQTHRPAIYGDLLENWKQFSRLRIRKGYHDYAGIRYIIDLLTIFIR
jgi:hypothetical protein